MKLKINDCFNWILTLFYIDVILLESNFVDMQSIKTFLEYFRFVLIGVFLAIAWFKRKKEKKNTVMIVLLLLIFIAVNFVAFSGGMMPATVLMIVLAAKNVPLKQIFKNSFFTLLFSHIFIMGSSYLGIIEDNVGSRYIGNYTFNIMGGEYIRHSMGFFNANQVPMTFLILYLYLIVLKRNKITFWENIVFLILNSWIFYNFGSRLVYVLFIATMIMYYLIIVKDKMQIGGKISFHLGLVYPLSALGSFLLTYLYNSSNQLFNLLDLISNHRLSMGHSALNYYNFSLFGFGKEAATYQDFGFGYTVDNGYICMYIQQGIILFLTVIMIFLLISRVAEKNNNVYLVYVLAIFAIINVVNSAFISYKAIPFYCILANINDITLNIEERVKKKELLLRPRMVRTVD